MIRSVALFFICVGFIFCRDVHAQTFKVLTYNIRYDNPGDSINAWPNRKGKVSSLLKKYDPDLIGVQEALYHQLTDLLNDLPEYVLAGVGRDDGRQKGEYSAILVKKSKFGILEENTFWLSETPSEPGSKSWDAAITRIVTWVKLADKSNGRKFVFINTHFDHIGKEARAKSAEILKATASELGAEMPVIITGDFNCTPEEDPYKILTNTNVIELIDPAPEPKGTFCNFAVGGMECRRIDYIFVTNEWRSDRYKVIEDNDGKYYPSDHLPVMVNLSWTD